MDTLYAQQNSLCYWCGSQTVIARHIPNCDLLKITGNHVFWKRGDEVFCGRMATIDHVIPLRDNGSHAIGNCVMACAECNRDRTKTESPVAEEIRRVCPECKGVKPKQRRLCTECFVKKAKALVGKMGWLEIDGHNPGFFMYVDPQTGDSHHLRGAWNLCQERMRENDSQGGES